MSIDRVNLLNTFFLFSSAYSLKKRSLFTLLELLLVLTIAFSAVAVVAFNIKGLLEEQRYKNEVTLVTSTLRLAQEMMLLLEVDVTITFLQTAAGSTAYRIDAEGVLNSFWQKIIQKERPPLRYIKVNLSSDGIEGDLSEEEVTLKFFSQGTAMTRGVLTLYPLSGEEERAICLPGYPASFQPETREMAIKYCLENKQRFSSLSSELHPLIQAEAEKTDNQQKAA